MKKRVLLFGLSANPPTGLSGHAGIVRWAAEASGYDEVWVLPVYQHPFADKREMPYYEHRFNMAKLAFEPLGANVFVKDADKRAQEAMPAGLHAGTIDVVRLLEKEHPDAAFALLLGTDTYRDLVARKWKESEALLERVPIVVVARQGIDPPAFNAVSLPGLSDVSSSRVRAMRDRDALARVLQPEVLAYIEEHGLYAFGASPDPHESPDV